MSSSPDPLSPAPIERIDLHTHSTHSDGVLTPVQLVELAAGRKVQVLALTDHDTVAGCAAALAACRAHGIGFVPGAELTCDWRGREIHVVALGIDPQAAALQRQMEATLASRRQRVAAIGARLARERAFAGEDLGAAVLAEDTVPTRMHVARLLVARGHADSTAAAFERWLRRGRPGYVPAEWPPLAAVVQCIRDSGGIPVLAHPLRYNLGNSALRALVEEFAAGGGQAIEVSLAGQSPNDQSRAASLARRHGLAGSVASDFHEPGMAWRPLGRFVKLPDHVEPVLSRLTPV